MNNLGPHVGARLINFFASSYDIGAQWTGIVTTIAIEMLKAGMVEAVICVQRYWHKVVSIEYIELAVILAYQSFSSL